MKAKYLYLLLPIALWGTSPALAQIELPDATKEALEKYNEQEGVKDNPDEKMTPEQAAQMEKWKKQWEETMEEYQDASDFFNTKELNCVFLMVLYLDPYLDLEEQAYDCDLLGLQATAIALSTTIMYCPEHIASLSSKEWYPTEYELVVLDNYDTYGTSVDGKQTYTGGEDYPGQVKEWVKKFRKVCRRLGTDPTDGLDFRDALVYPFTPTYVVKETLEIGRLMDRMGCDER